MHELHWFGAAATRDGGVDPVANPGLMKINPMTREAGIWRCESRNLNLLPDVLKGERLNLRISRLAVTIDKRRERRGGVGLHVLD